MSQKITVALLFGGKSAEHEVSLQSAKNILEAIDKEKYDIVLIGVDRDGKWYLNNANVLLEKSDPDLIKLNQANVNLSLLPGYKSHQILDNYNKKPLENIDVVFPVLHGPFGEDGTVQGLLKIAGLPYVGAGVLGSAIGMDKEVMKRLLLQNDILTANFISFKINQKDQWSFDKIKDKLGAPFFVKPANLGSSVGIHKINNESEYESGIKDAFHFDSKIILEQNIKGREIECAVLGNDNPIVSIPGEVIAQHEFYDYEAKYIDEKGADLKIPADLPEAKIIEIQELAKATFETLECSGMARIDFFLEYDGTVLVNEINTIPGFTKISMYPKLWEASGISYSELIDRLIELALNKFDQESKLKNSYN